MSIGYELVPVVWRGHVTTNRVVFVAESTRCRAGVRGKRHLVLSMVSLKRRNHLLSGGCRPEIWRRYKSLFLFFRLTARLMGQIDFLVERHSPTISAESSMNVCWSGDLARYCGRSTYTIGLLIRSSDDLV